MRRVWAAAAVVGVIALGGCANPGELLAEKAAEKVIEQQLSSDGSKVDIDADGDGGMTIENEDGTYKIGAHAEVPEDFPSELPRLDTDLATASVVDGTWMLQYVNATRVDFDRLSEYFENGDYERTSTIEMAGMLSYSYLGAEWSVMIGMLGEEGDELALTYSVSSVKE